MKRETFICDACGEHKEGKPKEVVNTETLCGVVMCESCCTTCGDNTPERIDEQIEWLKQIAEKRKK